MCVQNLMAIQSDSYSNISLESTNMNLMVVLEVKSGDQQVSRIHPLWTMNVCAKCPSHSFKIHAIFFYCAADINLEQCLRTQQPGEKKKKE